MFETSEVRLRIKVKGGTYIPKPSTKGPQQFSLPGPGGKIRGGTSNDGTAYNKYNYSELQIVSLSENTDILRSTYISFITCKYPQKIAISFHL